MYYTIKQQTDQVSNIRASSDIHTGVAEDTRNRILGLNVHSASFDTGETTLDQTYQSPNC